MNSRLPVPAPYVMRRARPDDALAIRILFAAHRDQAGDGYVPARGADAAGVLERMMCGPVIGGEVWVLADRDEGYLSALVEFLPTRGVRQRRVLQVTTLIAPTADGQSHLLTVAATWLLDHASRHGAESVEHNPDSPTVRTALLAAGWSGAPSSRTRPGRLLLGFPSVAVPSLAAFVATDATPEAPATGAPRFGVRRLSEGDRPPLRRMIADRDVWLNARGLPSTGLRTGRFLDLPTSHHLDGAWGLFRATALAGAVVLNHGNSDRRADASGPEVTLTAMCTPVGEMRHLARLLTAWASHAAHHAGAHRLRCTAPLRLADAWIDGQWSPVRCTQSEAGLRYLLTRPAKDGTHDTSALDWQHPGPGDSPTVLAAAAHSGENIAEER